MYKNISYWLLQLVQNNRIFPIHDENCTSEIAVDTAIENMQGRLKKMKLSNKKETWYKNSIHTTFVSLCRTLLDNEFIRTADKEDMDD